MDIAPGLLAEFTRIYKEDYGIELSEEEAAKRFYKMKNLLKAVLLGDKDLKK